MNRYKADLIRLALKQDGRIPASIPSHYVQWAWGKLIGPSHYERHPVSGAFVSTVFVKEPQAWLS